MTILGVALLGPVVASVDGRVVPVTSARQAAILACLALQAPRLAGTALLIDAVWGDEPPARAEQGLQQHVSTLRGLLEPDRHPRTGSGLLRTEAGGYRLQCDALDVADFLAAADAGARAGAVDALVGAGLRGLVVAGTGNATVHEALLPALLRAERAGVAVRLVSRCAAGPVLAGPDHRWPVYASLSAAQARVELMLELIVQEMAGASGEAGPGA